jgi:hypothetical protein
MRFLPKPFSPDALMIILSTPSVSSFALAYPQTKNRQRITWGKDYGAD